MCDWKQGVIFPRGPENAAFAPYFVGRSYLNMLSLEGVVIGNVTFEPGCRNNWYQEEGKPARELRTGDVVHIPANVKHWHGAAKDSWFAHLAVEIPGEGAGNEWCEPVDDEAYGKLP